MRSRSNRNLEVLVFGERGKPEYPEKNLSEQRREPTTNSTHIWSRRRDLNPGDIGGRRWEYSTCLCRIFFFVSALFKFCQINFVFLETTLTHTDRPFNPLIEGIAPLLRISLPLGVKNGTVSIQQHRHCFFLSRGLNAVFKVRIWKPNLAHGRPSWCELEPLLRN